MERRVGGRGAWRCRKRRSSRRGEREEGSERGESKEGHEEARARRSLERWDLQVECVRGEVGKSVERRVSRSLRKRVKCWYKGELTSTVRS